MNYIVTVETRFNREVICTLRDIQDSDHHYRRTEIESYQVASEWIKGMLVDFPNAKYHLYSLKEVGSE